MTRFSKYCFLLIIGLPALGSGVSSAPAADADAFVRSARKGDVRVVEDLLSAGFAADVQDSQGETALGWATFNGHADVVRILLGRGADPNLKNRYGNTPLIYAAAKGHTEILQLLIDGGAKPFAAGRGDLTPLVLAARDGHSETVRALLASVRMNADPGSRSGHTVALKAARKRGHKSVVSLLLGARRN